MNMESPLEVLLLCATTLVTAQTVSDHIRAISTLSHHNVHRLDLRQLGGHSLPTRLNLDRFDVILIHYSVYILDNRHLDEDAKTAIRTFSGLKGVFIQDEYRRVNDAMHAMRSLGIRLLFTCIPEFEVDNVYPSNTLPNVRKITTLTGFVPADFVSRVVPPISQRPIDVGYRGRKLPYHLGRLGLEKCEIVARFHEATRGSGLYCDLSFDEKQRLYGRRWIRFLTSCRAVLGTESGASVVDFTGEIERRVDEYVRAHPSASFGEVSAMFFASEEERFRLNQISPRCFEAAALRTAMVLFEGEYSGVLTPWRHYVPLAKDFSNINEVLRTLRDSAMLQQIADHAYYEVACNQDYSYARFVREIDHILAEEAPKSRTRTARAYTPLTMMSLNLPARMILLAIRGWNRLPMRARIALKPLLKPMATRLLSLR